MSNEATNTELNTDVAAPVEPVVRLPIRDERTGHCEPTCPFLKAWIHPFYHHTAWCWKQMRNLSWYDYWLADCLKRSPDEALVNIKHSGRTQAI